MILSILRTMSTLQREYPLSRVVLRGSYGTLRGLWQYYRNRQSVSRNAYVNYFIVLEVTGQDPLGGDNNQAGS